MQMKTYITSAVLSFSSLVLGENATPTANTDELKHATNIQNSTDHQIAHQVHSPRLTLEQSIPGTFSADIGIFADTYNNSDDGSNGDFISAYIAPHYVLEFGSGFSFEAGAIFTKDLKDNGSYDDTIADNSVLSELNLGYTFSETKIKLGRQSLEHILLEDYFDGVSFVSNEIDGLTLRGAWVKKGATLDPDDLTKFSKDYFGVDENDSQGVYSFEADYEVSEAVTVSGAYLYAPDYFQQYGAAVSWECGINTLTTEYFIVDNDEGEDGYMFHIDNTIQVSDPMSLSFGYIQTSEDAGVAGLMNNFYDIFAEDNIEDYYNINCWYVSSTYSFSDRTELTATFGIKDADFEDEDTGDLVTGETIKEFDLILTHNFTDSISSEFAFVSYNPDEGDSWNRFYASLVYSF